MRIMIDTNIFISAALLDDIKKFRYNFPIF